MSAHTRIGDGLALGGDLLVAARQAVASALAPLAGERPDLACVFVSGGTPEKTRAALVRAAELTGARTTVGCGAHGVMAAGRGIEATGGVSVWVAVLPSVPVRAFHLEVLRTDETVAVLGMPQRRDDDVVGVLLADPWSFPADGFVAAADTPVGHLPLVGGLASGAAGPGDTCLLVDGQVRSRGAVGVVLGGDLAVHTLVSQGCRPLGHPMTVTASEGETLLSLAGRPAFEQAKAAISTLPAQEQVRAVRGLTLGIAEDEYADVHTDFDVRQILAADHASGAISVGGEIPVGTTVQFMLRDATAAHSDLAEVLGAFRRSVPLEGLAGALVFSGNSRGRAMFPTPDHDVTAVRGGLGLENVAGFFTAGEIGPLGGRNRLHGHAATVLAFGA
jgi:small ligand-binding sensory domain FIST